jgi:hypothetical protein
VRTLSLLLISWAAGLAAYWVALSTLRGEVLSLNNWVVIGCITLVAWLVSAVLVIVPILRLLLSRHGDSPGTGLPALAGAGLAIVPLWLNIWYWYGWQPRHLLVGEAGFLGVLYATSGMLLGLSLARYAPGRSRGRH